MIHLSPSTIPIAYIDIRVFAHATEDSEKVLTAVRNVLPTELTDKVVFKKTNLKGHYGNSITLFKTKIKEKNEASRIFEKLASNLSIRDKKLLCNEIKQHLDKGNLYIRLDKQSAYLNKVKLHHEDSIHFRIHFRKSNPEEIVKICKDSGLLP